MTKQLLSLLTLSIMFCACNSSNEPDVSNIKIQVTTTRFEQDLFAMKPNNLTVVLPQLQAKYPVFTPDFFGKILNADPAWPADTLQNYVSGFIKEYQPVYDSAQKLYANFTDYSNQIIRGLKYVKYYFPTYKLPTQIVTYVGPLDGYGDILTENAIVVGLQHHLGAGSNFYKTTWVQEVYPGYITNRFTPSDIQVNALKNIVLDIYPNKMDDKTLAIQMVEHGKQLYVLQKFLPAVPANMLLGYTKKQYDESIDHERSIWELFIQNNLLQTQDNNAIKNYIGDSPKTQELGEASPGNIGSFTGWQIVKAYMNKFPETSPANLLALDAEKLFAEAKYKP